MKNMYMLFATLVVGLHAVQNNQNTGQNNNVQQKDQGENTKQANASPDVSMAALMLSAKAKALTPNMIYYSHCMQNLEPSYSKFLQIQQCSRPPVNSDVNCSKTDNVVTTSVQFDSADLDTYCRALSGYWADKPKGAQAGAKLTDATPMNSRIAAVGALGKAVQIMEEEFMNKNIVTPVQKTK
jgi:hypothetical protein